MATRLTAPQFQQLIESRDAHLGALTGVAFAEGVRRAGAVAAAPSDEALDSASGGGLDERRHRLLRLGRRQRDRGHRACENRSPRAATTCTCSAQTRRSGWAATSPGSRFHRVHTPAYPLFREPQYVLALASRIVQVAREWARHLHAHYAVPHATAAYLAKQILCRRRRHRAASDHDAARHRHHARRQRSLVLRTVAFSIEESDGVTAVSESLRQDTYRTLAVRNRSRSSRIFSTATSITGFPRRPCARATGRPDARSSSSTSRISGR